MTQTKTIHEQIRIRHGGAVVDVDKKIASLIRGLWRAGIDTVCSCQDYPGFGLWVMMPAEHDPQFRGLLRDYPRQFTATTISITEDDLNGGGWRHPGA